MAMKSVVFASGEDFDARGGICRRRRLDGVASLPAMEARGWHGGPVDGGARLARWLACGRRDWSLEIACLKAGGSWSAMEFKGRRLKPWSWQWSV
nr:hypothetical protein Itr_chr06CG24260 [Ipomoea trifida]GLL30570.1 hypothetical protein Itr_chr06CG24280 [Ipomoea trifida]